MVRKGVSIFVLICVLAALCGFHSPAVAAGEIKLSMGPFDVPDSLVDRVIDVPLMVDNAGSGMGIIAYQFDLAYDPTWLEVVPGSVADGDALSSQGGAVISASEVKYLPGLLKDVSYALRGGGAPFEGRARLASLRMRIKAGAPNGRYDLMLQNVVLTNPFGQSYPASAIAINSRWIRIGATDGALKLSMGPFDVPDSLVDRVIDVPLMIDNAGSGMGIIAYQFDLAYDPAWLEVVPGSVADGDALNTLGGMVIPGSTPKYLPGLLKDVSYSLMGGAAAFEGRARLASLRMRIKAGAPNGRYDLMLQNVVLTNPFGQSYPASTIAINSRWIRIGPAPNLQVSAVNFAPIGMGETFRVSLTIANLGGALSDPDAFDVAALGASPSLQPDQALPPIAPDASLSFDMGVYTLAGGSQSARITVTIRSSGVVFSATYSPLSDRGVTHVDATFGAFLEISAPDMQNFVARLFDSGLHVQCNTSFQVDVLDGDQRRPIDRDGDSSDLVELMAYVTL